MVRKTVEIPDKLWREFEIYAVKKFGYYGAIKKAVMAAISSSFSSLTVASTYSIVFCSYGTLLKLSCMLPE